jgi:hypothetical protein
MKAADVSDTLDEALTLPELDSVKVKQKAHLLSDNGPLDQLW